MDNYKDEKVSQNSPDEAKNHRNNVYQMHKLKIFAQSKLKRQIFYTTKRHNELQNSELSSQ